MARTGDKSKESVVTVFTQDGSAKAGIHYEPQAKVCIVCTGSVIA